MQCFAIIYLNTFGAFDKAGAILATGIGENAQPLIDIL